MRDTTKKYKYSVVIPAYNSANSILKALDSCVNQTYRPYEIIVVDDCSTDATLSHVQKFSKNFEGLIRPIKLKENSGPSHARNIGLDNSSGDYVAFLDSDDFWFTRKIEYINEVISKHPNAFIVGHNYEYPGSRTKNKNFISTKKLGFWNLLARNITQTSCVVIKNNSQFRFNEKFRCTEDHELWLRMSHKNEVLYVGKVLTRLGRKPFTSGGLTGKRIRMRFGEIKMYFEASKYEKKIIPLIPILILFSMLKHVKNLIFGYQGRP
jgi:teichuronic acid biosynthesis glycosyltransferase TuaG